MLREAKSASLVENSSLTPSETDGSQGSKPYEWVAKSQFGKNCRLRRKQLIAAWGSSQ